MDLKFPETVRELRSLTGGSQSCGWMYDEVAFLLYSLVKFYKPALIIQTGHLWGKSSCMMMEAITDGFLTGLAQIEQEEQNADLDFSRFVNRNAARPDPDPKVISVDPGPLGVLHSARGIEYLQSRYPGVFEFHETLSTEFFRSHAERLRKQFQGRRIMGVVDGDHSSYGCIQDLIAMHNLGAELLFLDDVNWLPHLGNVGKTFARKYGYEMLRLPLYNGVAVFYGDSIVRAGKSSFTDRLMAMIFNIAGTPGLRAACLTKDVPLIRRTIRFVQKTFTRDSDGPR